MRVTGREAFVRFMTAGQPARPANIANIVAINQGHRPLTMDEPIARALAPGVVAGLAARGHLVIDTRRSAQFGAGHVPGALNVHLSSPEFEQRVGWVAAAEVPLILVLDGDADAPRAMHALAFVGLDARVAGALAGGMDAWTAEGLPVTGLPQVDVRTLHVRLAHDPSLRVLDVREPSEWAAGRIRGARQVSYRQIAAGRGGDVAPPAGGTLAVICQGGSRSSTAASLLQRTGVQRLVNVEGGMSAWIAAGLPVETGVACADGPAPAE